MGLFSAIAGLAGDIYGTERQIFASNKQQENAQDFSKWQMANAHQEEVKDLQKAGLNPVMSAGGNGASAGVGGHTASSGGTQYGSNFINNMVASQQKQQMKAETNNIKAQNANINATTDQIKAQTSLIKAQTANADADTPRIKAESTSATNNRRGRETMKWIDTFSKFLPW